MGAERGNPDPRGGRVTISESKSLGAPSHTDAQECGPAAAHLYGPANASDAVGSTVR